MSLPRFGFLVTFFTYIVLLFAEYLRPGFVSSAMNVHVLWIAMIGWIVVEIVCDRTFRSFKETSKDTSLLLFKSTVFVAGIVFALITWRIGSVFGDMRLFFAITIGILPMVFFVKCPKKSGS